MKEMTFYRDKNNGTYSRIGEKVFCFDENKFINNLNIEVTQYGSSFLEQFNSIVALAKAGGEEFEFSEKEIEESKIIFMKSYFCMNGFGR